MQRSYLLAVLAFLVCSVTAEAVTVGLDQGLQFSQLNLTFEGDNQPDSGYGLAVVDFDKLVSETGLSKGYLNIATPTGWAVQNMPIDAAWKYPGSSVMFNLGNTGGNDVTSLMAYADFSAAPATSFAGGPAAQFAVGDLDYNAEGRGLPAPPGPVPPPPPVPVIPWNPNGATKAEQQVFRKSVEQDKNQCGPGSLANSLQYLEDVYGIFVSDDHVPGINGNPSNSMVGAIDTYMKRQPHQTVTDWDFMTGKLDYIEAAGLDDDLVIKHWGGGFAPGDWTSTDGSVVSKDETDTMSLIDWVIDQIEDGEDVELALGGSMQHWINVTGAGEILGIPWISWTHDAKQGNNDDGTTSNNGGTDPWDGGTGWSPIIDGQLVFFLAGATPDFAVSESIAPEPGTIILMAGAVAGFAGVVARKMRRT